jgi:hypothetical protein
MGGEYSIYQVFKSKLWEVPHDADIKRLPHIDKLTFSQMKEVHSLWEQGEPIKSLSAKFNVSNYIIGRVIKQVMKFNQ